MVNSMGLQPYVKSYTYDFHPEGVMQIIWISYFCTGLCILPSGPRTSPSGLGFGVCVLPRVETPSYKYAVPLGLLMGYPFT